MYVNHDLSQAFGYFVLTKQLDIDSLVLLDLSVDKEMHFVIIVDKTQTQTDKNLQIQYFLKP